MTAVLSDSSASRTWDVLVIAGPTGVGKTGLSIRLAKMLDAEIICCDSRQLYRFCNIGTAKPTDQEQAAVPHHLLDILSPDENSNAYDYAHAARQKIDELKNRGKPAILVGGTGLYIKATLHGLFAAPNRDPAFQQALRDSLNQGKITSYHDLLTKIDPASAATIDPRDQQRILRALEFHHATGEPISQFREEHRFQETPFRYLYLVLMRQRQDLYARIDSRVDSMIAEGWLDEVITLLKMGYPPDCDAMTSIGYRQLVQVAQGMISLSEAAELIKRDTRRYAKRQISWFRGVPDAHVIEINPHDTTENVLEGISSHLSP